jgi:hypothetical protein
MPIEDQTRAARVFRLADSAGRCVAAHFIDDAGECRR